MELDERRQTRGRFVKIAALAAAALESDGMTAHEINLAIRQERISQDEQWGGADHDAQHGPHDWLDYITKQITKCRTELADKAG